VRTRGAHHAAVFRLAVRASLLSHYSRSAASVRSHPRSQVSLRARQDVRSKRECRGFEGTFCFRSSRENMILHFGTLVRSSRALVRLLALSRNHARCSSP
jgi:hypothetical protein